MQELNYGAVYVCAERDIECGSREANWCAKCPKRRAAPADVGEDGQISDAEIAGIMGWRGPGAYTATSMRKIRRVVEQAIAAERDRNMARIQHLTHERDEARAVVRAGVDDLEQLHAAVGLEGADVLDADKVIAAIADLRAQLAVRGRPVHQVCVEEKRWLDIDAADIESWKRLHYPVRTLATPQPAAPQEPETCPECGKSDGWHKLTCSRTGDEDATPQPAALPEQERWPYAPKGWTKWSQQQKRHYAIDRDAALAAQGDLQEGASNG